MDTDQVIQKAKELKKRIQTYAKDDFNGAIGAAANAQVSEFLRQYAGPKSSFLKQAELALGFSSYVVNTLTAILDSFVEYLEAGLATGISPARKAQIDVVSDFLGQAQILLEISDVHPAAPTILIGASLEEFLRNWIEEAGLSIGSKNSSIDAYAKTLREQELITKQDVKDITAWGGLRNHAAHGEWDQVSDKSRVMLMLEGVNLFMRKYGG